MKNVVAIVGYFPDKGYITQASELAKILSSNGYKVYKTSARRNKWLRLLDIAFTLFTVNYTIAIVQFYSGNSFMWQYLAAKIVKMRNKKLVFTIHGGGVPKMMRELPNLYLPLLKSAHSITVPSEFIMNELKQYSINSVLIENSIPLDKYNFYSKPILRPSILWMRAFSDIYNPLMAVRVVADLRVHYPALKLYMAGNDLGQLSETKRLINELNLNDNIEIVGFLDFNKKMHYAELCDIYISTNKIDNAPVTVVEMWAMGLPVISTDVGGIKYMIKDSVNGLLAKDNNHKMMAGKIRGLLENNQQAQQIITNGRKEAAKYNEDVVYKKWDDFLSS